VPQKRLSCSERRNQIIQVAMNLFASLGFKGTTTRAIASAAGVSEAIIFRHFRTKEDLYDAIITTSIEQRTEIWSNEAPDALDADLPTLMSAYAQSFVRQHREDQTFIRLMLYSSLQDHKFRQRFLESSELSPLIKKIREKIQSGVDSGDFLSVDPQLTTMSLFFSLLQYCLSRFVGSSELPTQEADDAYVDNLIRLYTNSLQSGVSDPALTL
tara:strand:- start:235 stop:873 length:639 start_codon:yes stop_codon:yes gene_type:complete